MTVAPLNTFGTRAVWEWVAMIGAQSFTGEVRLATTPGVVLFAARGAIYWAEQESDPSLVDRLVTVGALQPQQLERGAVRIGDVVHLGRLFDRDPSVDRHVAEVAVELMRDDLLDRVAMQPCGATAVAPLRFHPSGIHRWFTVTNAGITAVAFTPESESQPIDQSEVEPATPAATTPAAEPEPYAAEPVVTITSPSLAPAAPVAAESAPTQRIPVVQFDFDRAFAPLKDLANAKVTTIPPETVPAQTVPAQTVPGPTVPTSPQAMIDPTSSPSVPMFTSAPIPLTTHSASPSLTELWTMADSVLPTADDKDESHG